VIADMCTVMWKEWKEVFLTFRTSRLEALSLIAAFAFLGVFPALDMGREWLSSPLALLLSSWIPLILVSSSVADSIAGERERHTLESLLATRLSDGSILLGKIFASAGFGWGFALAVLLLNVAAICIADPEGGLMSFSPLVGLAAAVLSLLTSVAASCVGVLVSLRSPTARQAQQLLMAASVLSFLLIHTAARATPIEWHGPASGELIIGMMGAIVAVLGPFLAVAFLLAMRRFRRRALLVD
jgi:ABC-2 type transport system permease protein